MEVGFYDGSFGQCIARGFLILVRVYTGCPI